MTDLVQPIAVHDPLAGHYAGFWVKTAALVVDLALSAPLCYGVQAAAGPAHPVLSEVVCIVILFAFYCLFFGGRWHATPGMRLLGFHICDTQGQPLSLGRSITWIIVSTLGLVVCLGGIVYMAFRFDIYAALQLLSSCAEENIRLEDCAVEVEQIIGIPYETFARMCLSAVALALFLMLVWALSVGLAKDKSGFHNLICGTRFIKGRL